MVSEYVMTHRNLVNSSMNVMAGMRMVIELQAVPMSSNAVIRTGSLLSLGRSA